MSILTVTLNPAIDLTTDVDKVESGSSFAAALRASIPAAAA